MADDRVGAQVSVGRGRALRSLGEMLWRLALVAALGTFLIDSCRFVVAPEDEILRIVPDDAFYYLQIARNIVHLGRSTADGLSNTNGYHPLWMLIMTGLAWVVPQAGSLLRAAIVVSLTLHLVASVALSCSLRPIIGPRWAASAGACWLVNPLAFLIAQQTVEATIYVVALLAVLTLYLRIRSAGRQNVTTRMMAVFGASLGLACLARTEGIIIVALVFVSLLTGPIVQRSLAVRSRRVATAGLVSFGVVLPWLWFSWAQVGTIVQDSGAMKALWASDVQPQVSDRVRNLLYTGSFFVRRSFAVITGVEARTGLLVGLCVVAAATFAFLQLRDPRGQPARAIRAAAVPTIAIWLSYGLALTEQQVWWLTVPSLAFMVITFVALSTIMVLCRLDAVSQTWCQAALVSLSVAAFTTSYHAGPELYPWQPDVRSSERAVEAIVPPSERIGCFNAGIPMFFGSGRVVALDGLVSHRAKMFWTAHKFDEFLRESHVAFIADDQRAMNRALRFVQLRPRLDTVASYPLTGWPTHYRHLWRVTWERS